MWHDIKNIFHFIIIFQCLLFAFYLLSQKNARRKSNLLLAGFLFSKAVTEIGGIFYHFGELRNIVLAHTPFLFYIDIPFRYLYVPLLFLYILSLIKKDFVFKKIFWLHFSPFILISILFFFRFYIQSADALREILRDGSRFTPAEDLILSLAEYLQFFAYAVASLLVLSHYRHRIKDVYSTIENINLSWMNFVLFGFIGWKSLWLIEKILWHSTGSDNVMYLYIAAEIVFLAFVCVMFLKGLKQPVVFKGPDENQFKRKYEKTLLSGEQKEEYTNKLIHFMETQKPFLDPSLSLNDLAGMVAIPAYQLSQVINSCLHQNFYYFINSYRVKESQQLLSEKAPDQKTVLEILYETGFNSKSVFNSAFKKYTGMTPSQFRKNQEC